MWYRAFALFLALLGFLRASDLSLRDGRVLKDATIKSETPSTVVIWHSGGIASVPKSSLPDELLAQHPIDGAAAAQADTRAHEAADLRRAAELKKLDALREKRKKAENSPAPPISPAKARTLVRDEVLYRAELLFESRYKDTSDYKKCYAYIDEIKPISDKSDVWQFTGHVTVYRSRPGLFGYDKSDIGDANWRNQHNVAGAGTLPSEYATETVYFDGSGTVDNGAAAVEITPR